MGGGNLRNGQSAVSDESPISEMPASSNSVKIMIPLYSYPTWYNQETYFWKQVVEAAKQVPITAVINPNNGPDGGPPNKDYLKGLADLRTAKMTILGYVFTNYGKRNLADVKVDIDLYEKHYKLDGIFLDEAASSADKLDYYQEIYNYIKAKSHLKLVVLNQGTHADEGYLTRPAADITIISENYPTAWEQYQPLPYVKRYDKNRFACLIHTVLDVETMKKQINLASDRNVGYVYITDDSTSSGDGDPWNSLPSYWSQEVDYVRELNQEKI
ncbi:MAG: Spherulation-specific family 4 [Hydrococcus sp. RM1_1_31]|nr:Spherulation-specific family 4 [Hydrococcus sp. RM1_1_31]